MNEPTAVYRLFAADDTLLYIGISKRFGDRWIQHAKAKEWWPEVHHQTISWYDSEPAARQVEEDAIKAEHPRFNIIHSASGSPASRARKPRIQRQDWDAPVVHPKTKFSTPEVAALARVSRATVEREIHRGTLAAERVARTWIVAEAEANRWAAQFQPYAALRQPRKPPPAA